MHEVGRPLTIEDVEVATPQPDEVLVDVVAAGLCHSDLRFLEGSFGLGLPCVLGHEVAGVVRRTGEAVDVVKPGDHVVMSISVSCGGCALCISGKRHLCMNKGATRRAPDDTPRFSDAVWRPVSVRSSTPPR